MTYEVTMRERAEEMHAGLALRPNASSTTMANMAALGKPLPESLAAALLTLGGLHAPIERACGSWNSSLDTFQGNVDFNQKWERKSPGFGSSFEPGQADPFLSSFDQYLPAPTLEKMAERTAYVQKAFDRPLFPNAAMYTAVFADILGLRPTAAMGIVITGRTPVLIHIWTASYDGTLGN